MTIKWDKCSTELSDILAAAVASIPAQKRVMFGCPAYFTNGNMFAGVHGSNIVLRLPEADRLQMLREFDESTLFEPFPGRFMKEYVTVPAAVYEDGEVFLDWLEKAIKYAAALPPKTPKPKTMKKEKPNGSR
jgi:TfoX/Sxy family transcriptional regulator of competence genes